MKLGSGGGSHLPIQWYMQQLMDKLRPKLLQQLLLTFKLLQQLQLTIRLLQQLQLTIKLIQMLQLTIRLLQQLQLTIKLIQMLQLIMKLQQLQLTMELLQILQHSFYNRLQKLLLDQLLNQDLNRHSSLLLFGCKIGTRGKLKLKQNRNPVGPFLCPLHQHTFILLPLGKLLNKCMCINHKLQVLQPFST
jgi:hypothetical protein